MSYLLALDAGTGSIRAVIFDLNGRQLAVGRAEWKHLSVDNVPGSMEFDLPPTGSWPASAFARRSTPPGSLPPIFSPSPAVRCAKASFSMTATARPSGPAPTSMPAPAAKWRSLRRSTTIASNPRYTRSRDKPWRSAPCRACCGWRTTADIYRKAATITMISDWLAAKLSGELAVDRQTPAPPACSICSAATGVRRCWIWPGCAPICCRRSKRPVPCWAPSPKRRRSRAACAPGRRW